MILNRETNRPELELIAMGTHFWCDTHLSAVPIGKRSPDRRYCHECYDFLVEETRMLAERGVTKRPAWIPDPLPDNIKSYFKGINIGRNSVTTYLPLSGDDTVDVTAPEQIRTTSEDGKKAFPQLESAIEKMVKQGLSSRAIAEQLRLKGFNVSHMTVARYIRKKKMTA